MPNAAQRVRAPRLLTLGAAAALLAGLALSGAAPAAAADPVLGVGETASSKNMSLVANLPKNGAFAEVDAFNSDLAFKDSYAFAGNYNGFTVYDIKNPRKPTQVTQVVCPGSQNDLSVSGDLLFLSVDSRRTDRTCRSEPATDKQSASGNYFEGIRIFDISDPASPKYIRAVQTDCGSHTQTLVPGKDGKNVYVYVSSYGPSKDIKRCQPPHDKISVIQVPVDKPREAAVIATPGLFPEAGGVIARTEGCHDITAYPAKDLAAGACMGQGLILDISDPATPQRVESVSDTVNFDFWHSATFSNAADKVIFTDELGGGGAPTCNPAVGPNKGADAIYRLGADKQLTFASYYKIPRTQADTENCVAHNGSLIPVEGKDVMVQAWYQGGISVFDFTDPARPTELGWFDRGPLSAAELVLGGSWSAYYYQGFIFSNDIQKGLDVFEIRDRRVASARSAEYPSDFNVQSQPEY